MLSLSGPKYRSNNITDNRGNFVFVGLSESTFHLRPILKEYKFEPSSLDVAVVEGKTSDVVFKAIRYAYSAFGIVKTLTGDVASGATIEASDGVCLIYFMIWHLVCTKGIL